MKTKIDSQKGVHIYRDEDGIYLEGKEYHEAPFDDRWDDLRAKLQEGTGPAALTYEQYRDTEYFMKFFRYNQTDKIFMSYQMPHGWDTKTGVRPHMHMIPMASGSGNISFNFAYTWANINSEFNSASGWVSGSISTFVDVSEQYHHKVISFAEILPEQSAAASSILIFKVERNIADDTYESPKDHGNSAANVAIIEFDLHYRKLNAGTVGEFL